MRIPSSVFDDGCVFLALYFSEPFVPLERGSVPSSRHGRLLLIVVLRVARGVSFLIVVETTAPPTEYAVQRGLQKNRCAPRQERKIPLL